MRVQVGPIPSGSVTMWVAYARTVLAQALARPDAHRVSLPNEAIEGFEQFLDIWSDLAEHHDVFIWVADVDAEQVEFLTHAWFGLAGELATEADGRGYPLSPPEGDEFYQSLVRAVIDALSEEGRSRVEYSEQLRDEWPGLKES